MMDQMTEPSKDHTDPDQTTRPQGEPVQTTSRIQNEPVQTITAQTEATVIAPLLHGCVFNDLVHINFGSAFKHKEKRTSLKADQDITDSTTASSSNAPQTSGSSVLTADQQLRSQLMSTLKDTYESILIGNSQKGHTQFLEDIYTDLTIVQNESGGVLQEHEVIQLEMSSIRPTREQMFVKCRDLFKVQSGTSRQRRKVLTMGIAGVGKTVSVNKFILNWAKKEDNQDINFVFPLPFRELNLKTDKKYSLVELLNDCFFSSKSELKSLPEDGSQVLFIFDGLDECRFPLCFKEDVKDVTQKASVGSLITNLLKRKLLRFALVWVTCRPAAAHLIPRDYINLVTEVQGFNDEQKEAYFSKYFEKDTAMKMKVISHIKKSRSLNIMCQIPVFCWISATVLRPLMVEESQEDIPTNLTGMYTSFLLQQKNLMKKKYNEEATNAVDAERIILKLAKLAFRNLESGSLIFYKHDLTACGIDVKDGTVFSGVCTQIFSQQDGISERNIFSFVHLSVQESLAALFVHHSHCNQKSNAFKPKTFYNKLRWKTKTISDLHKYAVKRALQSENGHLDLFLRFLLGLSLGDGQHVLAELLPALKNKSKSVQATVDYIKKKLNEDMSSDRSMNLLHCLSELKDNSLTTEIQKYLNSGDVSKLTLSPTQWSALVFVLLISEETQERFELKKYRPSDEGLVRLLPIVKNTERALLDHCNLSSGSCSSLASVFSSDSAMKELDLSNNDLQDSGVQVLSAGLKSSHCKIEILRLSTCKLSRPSCDSLQLVLQSETSSLKTLDLSNNDLQDSGVQLLSVGLKSSHSKLQILRLNRCKLKQSCESLQSVLESETQSLKELDLSNNDLEDSGVQQLCVGLTSLHCKLEILSLAMCKLCKHSCNMLRSVLESGTSSLKELDLSNNDLQDSGVHLLSDGLKSSHCKLQILRLSGCMVTEEGCSSLASALSLNPLHLKELDLTYNHPGVSGLKLLSAILKDPHYALNILRVEHGGKHRITPGLKKYAYELTLDPNTAHTRLSLSKGNRKVVCVRDQQSYPDHPERFDVHQQVMSKESLTGRCYWELKQSGGGADIALTYKTISRKGGCNYSLFGRNEKSWSLERSDKPYRRPVKVQVKKGSFPDDCYSVYHNNKESAVSAPPLWSDTVAVYIDCPAGTLSFYGLSSDYRLHPTERKLTHLHTIHTTFTEPLYAGFRVYNANASVYICET